jgi:hypothetical protein
VGAYDLAGTRPAPTKGLSLLSAIQEFFAEEAGTALLQEGGSRILSFLPSLRSPRSLRWRIALKGL